MVLTGVAGSGKTTLLIRLQRTLKPQWEIVFLSYTALSFIQLLRFISDRLGLAAEELSESDRLETLASRFRRNLQGGKRTLLIIDEAQSLRRDALEKLSRLCAFDADVGLSIVLCGQPALEQTLRNRALHKLNAHIDDHFRLGALQSRDVEAYVAQRLHADGSEQTTTIGAKALERVIHYTHGIPRLINIVCGNALRLAADRGGATIDTVVVEQGAAMAAKGAQPMRGAVPLTRPSPVLTNRVRNESTTASHPVHEPMTASTGRCAPTARTIQRPRRASWNLRRDIERASSSLSTVLSALRARQLAALQRQPWTGASLACLLAITLLLAWPIDQEPNAAQAGHSTAAYGTTVASTVGVPTSPVLVEPPVAARSDRDITARRDMRRVGRMPAEDTANSPAERAIPRSAKPTALPPKSEQLQGEIAALTGQRDALVVSLKALETQALSVRRKLQASQGRVAASENKAEMRRTELVELRAQKDGVEAQLAELQEESAAQATTIAQLRTELEGAKQTIAAYQAAAAQPEKASRGDVSSTGGSSARTHRVRQGETLSSIAASSGTTVMALMTWNGLSDPDTLVAGQRLLLRPARNAVAGEASANTSPSHSHSPNARRRTATVGLDLLSTRLLTAVKRGEPAAVRASLARGARVNAADATSKTALMHAADRGQLVIVHILLRSGAQFNLKDNSGETALSFAAWSGYPAVASALLMAGATVDTRNAGGWSPLMYAAINGHDIVVAKLLAGGAAVDLSNREDQTALTAAAWNGHLDVVVLLLRARAQVDARSKDGWTPLMHAALNGHTSSVSALLANGASPNTRDRTGDTALIHAARNGHLGVVKALVAARADAGITNRSGENAKSAAAKQGHRQIVGILKRAQSRGQVGPSPVRS
jgi:ankyrin repeat protein/type II secretory pathway predicted ATPase ExeA